MSFAATIAAVVAELRAAGLEATSDVRNLNPPAVLVTPAAALAATKLCGTGFMRLTAELVARDSGDTEVLDQLDRLYAAALPVLAGRLTTDPRPFSRRASGSDKTGLPAIRLTLQTQILTDPVERNTP